METKKIVTIVAVIAVVGVVAWQAMIMFGGDNSAQEEVANTQAPAVHPDMPKQAALIPPPPPASAVKPLTQA
jgi:flagellar basal body-associated protein FliL